MADLIEYHKLDAWYAGKIAGAFSAFDMQAIQTGCDRLKDGDVYVEVGTQNGRSAYAVSTMLPKGVKCTAVDILDAIAGPDTMSRKDFFAEYIPEWDFINKPSEEAAIGLGEMRKWKKIIKKRQDNAEYLMKSTWFQNNPIVNVDKHALMFFPMYVPFRDELMIYMEKHGIQTRTMMPLISQPITKPYLKKNYHIAEVINWSGLLIPVHQYLNKKQLDHMINTVEDFYEGTRYGI